MSPDAILTPETMAREEAAWVAAAKALAAALADGSVRVRPPVKFEIRSGS